MSSIALRTSLGLLALLCPGVLAGSQAPQAAPSPAQDTRLMAARQIMAAARYCALITVDDAGQPRARTVDPRPPDQAMVVYLVTQPRTRKVAQIEANPRVTLYYADAERAEYVTVMGTATLIRDPLEIDLHWLPAWNEHYPDRPEGAILIEVVPTRVEVLGRGIEPNPITWQPQGVEMGEANRPRR